MNRTRLRDLGITIGRFPTGPYNAITDVHGVLVGHSAEDVEKMHQAWFKAVTLSVILWCQPYIKDGDF